LELKLWSPFLDLEKEWHLDFPRFGREFVGAGFRPSIDVVKKDGELVVTAEIPGLVPDDIDITIEDDILTIKGEKAEEKEITEENRYVHERSYGAFQRRIPLPEGTSPDKMKATYDKGVLTVHVTLPEEKASEPRHIPVEINS
jgi:HSP20 family protein